jgi:NADH-quinone oxidoreductase subunit L
MAGSTIGFAGMRVETMTVLCLLLFVGAMGKSAQIGLHTWLPDAMEGPTPVSALIHAATMVTAGVFMVCRLSPMFQTSATAMHVVTYVGAAMFHLFTHAFFKALLFLGAGSVIHAMHHEQDMRFYGALRKKIPFTFWVMIAGTVAITGVGFGPVGFAGFWSKDAILESAYASG